MDLTSVACRVCVLWIVRLQAAVNHVQFSPRGDLIASASMDRTVRLWTPTVCVLMAAVGASCSRVARACPIASRPDVGLPWVRRKGKSTVLKGHSGAVRSVCFSADTRFLLTSSDDKTLKVWGLPTRRFQCSLSGHSNWVKSGVFSPDTRLALSGSDDKTVRVWDLTKRKCVTTFYDHSE